MTLREERNKDMAAFVVALKWRPEDYWNLTLAEREAIANALSERNNPSV